MPLTSNKILMDLVTLRGPATASKRPLFRCTPEEPIEDDDPIPREVVNDTEVIFDSDVWRDMGCPTQITVTVEPGDKLNT